MNELNETGFQICREHMWSESVDKRVLSRKDGGMVNMHLGYNSREQGVCGKPQKTVFEAYVSYHNEFRKLVDSESPVIPQNATVGTVTLNTGEDIQVSMWSQVSAWWNGLTS